MSTVQTQSHLCGEMRATAACEGDMKLEGLNEQHGNTKPLLTVQVKIVQFRAIGEGKCVQ